MKIASFRRLLCVCLTMCLLLGTVAAVPAFAAEPQVTVAATTAGFYTDANGVKKDFLGEVVSREDTVVAVNLEKSHESIRSHRVNSNTYRFE